MKPHDAEIEAVAVHSQQAVQKALKALLVWYQVEFPKTHDIKRLLDLLCGSCRPPVTAAWLAQSASSSGAMKLRFCLWLILKTARSQHAPDLLAKCGPRSRQMVEGRRS
jgi:hypothetical protein